MKPLLILLLSIFSASSGAGTVRPEQPPATSRAHFHHVHLNVTDPKATIDFYKKFFGANEVRYRGLSDGLFTEKSFILLTRVETAPPTNMGTSLWHIGWAGVDPLGRDVGLVPGKPRARPAVACGGKGHWSGNQLHPGR